jgi:hypothetical protein
MIERYTEDARQTIFSAKEEASGAGSSYIEAQHLLLGIMHSCEPELGRLLKLKELEATFRADLAANVPPAVASESGEIPLSNQSKRILAYAAEEAFRLDSPTIGSGHFLLGILRESKSMTSDFLLAHNVDLPGARQTIAMLSRSHIGDVAQHGRSRIGLASAARRRLWIGAGAQLALPILLVVGVAKSPITGRHLLVIGATWFVAAFAWHILGRFSFFWTFGQRNRVAAIALSYALGLLYQLFMFGWLIPLGVGLYRLALR